MPLKSISYKDYGGKLITEPVEGLLEKAKQNPFFPYPYPVLASMVDSEIEDHRQLGSTLSATELLKPCLRCVILQRNTDYTESIDDLWKRWRGTMWHKLFDEFAQEGDITETRFFAPILGTDLQLALKPDIIRPYSPHCGGGVIIDVKTTENVPRWDRVWDDHVLQLNLYRWGVNHAVSIKRNGVIEETPQEWSGINFKSVGIWYCSSEEVKPLEVRLAVNVPTTSKNAKNPTRVVKEADVWSDERVEEFLIPRYTAMHEALERYEYEGTLPVFPEGFDPMPARFWWHRYSPVAGECLRLWYHENR